MQSESNNYSFYIPLKIIHPEILVLVSAKLVHFEVVGETALLNNSSSNDITWYLTHTWVQRLHGARVSGCQVFVPQSPACNYDTTSQDNEHSSEAGEEHSRGHVLRDTLSTVVQHHLHTAVYSA